MSGFNWYRVQFAVCSASIFWACICGFISFHLFFTGEKEDKQAVLMLVLVTFFYMLSVITYP
jgi:hypothetical protein